MFTQSSVLQDTPHVPVSVLVPPTPTRHRGTRKVQEVIGGAMLTAPRLGESRGDEPFLCLAPLSSAANLEQARKLLVESMAAYLEADNALGSIPREGEGAAGEGETHESAIIEGAPCAALVCIASEQAFPEAIALVR